MCGADHRPIEITPEGRRVVDPMSIIGHFDFTPIAQFCNPTVAAANDLPIPQVKTDASAAAPQFVPCFPFGGYE